jgi:hypothetical protein
LINSLKLLVSRDIKGGMYQNVFNTRFIKSKRKTVDATDEKCKLVIEEPLDIQNYLLVKSYIWEKIDEYEYTILSLTDESDIKKYLDGKTHYATSSVLTYEDRALNIKEYTVC